MTGVEAEVKQLAQIQTPGQQQSQNPNLEYGWKSMAYSSPLCNAPRFNTV